MFETKSRKSFFAERRRCERFWGRGTQYIPTGGNRGRPRGNRKRLHGFSVDL